MIEAAWRGELDETDLSKLSRVERTVVLVTLGVKDVTLMGADAAERSVSTYAKSDTSSQVFSKGMAALLVPLVLGEKIGEGIANLLLPPLKDPNPESAVWRGPSLIELFTVR